MIESEREALAAARAGAMPLDETVRLSLYLAVYAERFDAVPLVLNEYSA